MLTSKCPECAGAIEMPPIGRGNSVRMACPICHCWVTVTLGVTRHYDASQFAFDVNGVPVRPLEKP